ncbi:MAG: hypothetical protein IJ223_07395 [Clostridia bacterium]|nr:hypothetical protein [Clostridia bacterium]
MEDLLNKPILDQLYEFRKEEFEQSIYESNDEIREIEDKVCELAEDLITAIKESIPNEKDLKKAENIFRKYELECGHEIEFWSKEYFKLGMIDRKKLEQELNNNK